MSLFLPLLLKMTGLYLCIGMGFLAVRKLEVNRDGISRLLFYLIVPLVFFHGVSKVRMDGATLAIPFIILLMCVFLSAVGYGIARRIWPDTNDKFANILGFAAGSGNMGYFGIPVALLVFDNQTVAVYILMIIGAVIYESTVGYAIVTRGHFHPRVALKKILVMPSLHGALLGMLMAFLRWPLPEFTEDFFIAVRGTYSVLGMMMVGMGLAGLTRFEIDMKFLSLTFIMKFLAWPLLAAGFIWFDNTVLHGYSRTIHDALMLISLAPLAVMSVIFATLFNAHPEKMATAVFASTCFALVYVPFMIGWLGLGHPQ